MRITVLAAGAWGTALAIAFARRHQIVLWTREHDVADEMEHSRENRRYLPGFHLPEAISVSTDLAASLASPEMVVIATPTAGLRGALGDCARFSSGVPVIWVCKGFESGTSLLPHQLAAELLPHSPYGVLSGPSFAQEVAQAQPTALTLAGSDNTRFSDIANALHGHGLRIYLSDDMVGVEIGGAVKNVLAIATGVCDGLKLGLNARAALMTRGLAEIARLGQALGAKRETLMGLAGMGDLILTCTGDLSRNRRVGLALAEGRQLPQILQELGHVAEGVPTAFEVVALAQKLGVDMPIACAVTAVLRGEVDVRLAVQNLLARDPRQESA